MATHTFKIRPEHLRATQGLVATLKSEAAWHESHLQALLASASALGQNGDAILSEFNQLTAAIDKAESAIAEADRRTARVVDAARRYMQAVHNHDAAAVHSTEANLLEACSLDGAPAPRVFGKGIGWLSILARGDSWREVNIVEGTTMRSGSLWLPPREGGYHPREVARLAMRELTGVDPDLPQAKDAYWNTEPYEGDEEEEDGDA